jgi:hypothetical protein
VPVMDGVEGAAEDDQIIMCGTVHKWNITKGRPWGKPTAIEMRPACGD